MLLIPFAYFREEIQIKSYDSMRGQGARKFENICKRKNIYSFILPQQFVRNEQSKEPFKLLEYHQLQCNYFNEKMYIQDDQDPSFSLGAFLQPVSLNITYHPLSNFNSSKNHGIPLGRVVHPTTGNYPYRPLIYVFQPRAGNSPGYPQDSSPPLSPSLSKRFQEKYSRASLTSAVN